MTISPKHVLVTGGCGFLGQHIVRHLHARYPDAVITAADLTATKWVKHVEESALSFSTTSGFEEVESDQQVGPRPSRTIRYLDCNITSRGEVADALGEKDGLPKVDVIIHTASPHLSMAHELLLKVNVGGTTILLEEGKKAGVKVFVHTSSASVVTDKSLEVINGNESLPLIVDEDESPEYYSLTKALAEVIAIKANDRSTHFLTCAIRPAGIFGEGDRQVLVGMIDAYKAGKTMVIIGDDLNRFDFTYVGNVAHAHLLAMEKLLIQSAQLAGEAVENQADSKSSQIDAKREVYEDITDDEASTTISSSKRVKDQSTRVDGEAFFITNNQPVYFWDFARAVWYQCGAFRARWVQYALPASLALGIASAGEFINWACKRPPPQLTKAKARFSTVTRVFDISKARDRLGYTPVVDIDTAMKRSMKWFRGEVRP